MAIPTPLSDPFLPLPHVLNIRRVPLPTSSTSPQLIRSGEILQLTSSDAQKYKIRTIFDLRSKGDMERYGSPLKVIDGVDVEWAPMLSEKRADETKEDGKSAEGLFGRDNDRDHMYAPSRTRAIFAAYKADPMGSFMSMYTTLLKGGKDTIAKVLRRIIRTEKDEAILLHCNAGKDRTGVLVAVILLLAEVPSSTIINDYALSKIGLEQQWDRVISSFMVDPSFVEDPTGALEMLTSRPETFRAFLSAFQRTYQDSLTTELDDTTLFAAVEVYARDVVGLTTEEVFAVKSKLKGE
ncbi:tyrosine phosphatase family-domain-containing protein [Hysterangium stoloniferum]|nr:tyrosine phosphatase family-domain-containing protein [Hysterangium stoloniferum]